MRISRESLSYRPLPFRYFRTTLARVTSQRTGYVCPIGFLLPLVYSYQKRAPSRSGSAVQANYAGPERTKWDAQKLMDKLNQNPVSTPRRRTERRASRRCKFNQLMRIRPSDPQRQHFDDMRGTISVSRTGVYFQTSEPGYEVGMRLFLIMPYSQGPGATNREYLAEVVRKDPLPNGLTGIGVKLLLETGPQHTYSFDPPLTGK
jgi:PilZ domain